MCAWINFISITYFEMGYLHSITSGASEVTPWMISELMFVSDFMARNECGHVGIGMKWKSYQCKGVKYSNTELPCSEKAQLPEAYTIVSKRNIKNSNPGIHLWINK